MFLSYRIQCTHGILWLRAAEVLALDLPPLALMMFGGYRTIPTRTLPARTILTPTMTMRTLPTLDITHPDKTYPCVWKTRVKKITFQD